MSDNNEYVIAKKSDLDSIADEIKKKKKKIMMRV